MRPRAVIQILSLVVIVAAGAAWMKSRATSVDLQTRLAAFTVRRDTARALAQKRDRLRYESAEATRHRQEVPAEPAPALVPPLPPPVSSLSLGEWCSAREWRNEGRSTPRGAVATLLWAAAGGDLAAMMPIIAFDEAGQKQAQALFNTLPPGARQAFPTPEALVAGLTIQAVPNNAAQLSWFHQRDEDHATVGLLLAAPDQPAPAEVLVVAATGDRPPMLSDSQVTRLTVLSLQRSPNGWQVVIPAAAIERLARRMSQPPAT